MIIYRKPHSVPLIITLVTVLMICMSACNSSDDPSIPTQDGEAYWKISSTVKSTTGSSALIIKGTPGTEWHARITEGTDWCSFSSKENVITKDGTVADGLNVLYVYYKVNAGKEQRQAQLTLQFADNAPKTFDLIQLAESQENLPAFNVWAELPSDKVNTNYQYVTHYVLLNNKTIRNYSICFDKTKKAALWVAYPIHTAYLNKTVDRTNRWAFDPIIPERFQANCVDNSYKGNYDRGHQLPSADRLGNDEMNAQTFYMSNMTPQLGSLNQQMWANLETKVRSYNCNDTLYVVTGAYFGPGAGSTYDGAGNSVPIPTNYFKVLLRTKSGSTGKQIKNCSPDELISIGFWVEQKGYGNIAPPASICTSVADIEQKTGFTFFPQVSSTVKEQNIPSQWYIK